MNFFDILFAEKHGEALSISHFDALFAKYIAPAAEIWGEYDGALPAQYSANGDYLADYRIYGASGGVGDDSGTAYGYEVDMSITGNIYNPAATDPNNGYMSGYYMQATGEPAANNAWHITEYISIDSVKKYVVDYAQQGYYTGMAFYDLQKNYLSGQGYMVQKPFTLTVPQNAAYARFSIINPEYYQTPTIKESEIISIYLGSSPLEADEYVDYGAGKIYRISKDTVFANGEATFAVGSSSQTVISQSSDWSKAYPAQGLYRIRFQIETSATFAARNTPALLFDDGTSIFESESLGYNLTSGWYEWDLTLDKDDANISALYYWVANNDAEIKVSNISMEKILSGGYVDPPVPLPALPTIDGVTIVDYAGQSAAVPSRFVAKYKKG